MTKLAADSEAISLIRRSVPEFEPRFREALNEEDGELGVFQAMSVFATWILERLQREPCDDATQRGFSAVERLITDRTIELGDAVAAEFIEHVWTDPQAVGLMGPRTRARASPRR